MTCNCINQMSKTLREQFKGGYEGFDGPAMVGTKDGGLTTKMATNFFYHEKKKDGDFKKNKKRCNLIFPYCPFCGKKYDEIQEEKQELIHDFFGLSYGSYLVLQRVLLQSMDEKWQADFVKMIHRLYEELDYELPDRTCYKVELRKMDGNNNITKQKVSDPYEDYERGRRQISKKTEVVQ